jgi:hypothetical protein
MIVREWWGLDDVVVHNIAVYLNPENSKTQGFLFYVVEKRG